jgi:O-antigen ligase
MLNLKELIVILAIALVLFRLARPIALIFMAPEDFSRRRNVWCVLTSAAFLSPSFWLFAAVATPVLLVSGRKESNPTAFYLFLLYVIPPLEVPVPMVGMPYLFMIDNNLLLSFCVMLPVAWRLLRSKDDTRIGGLRSMDYCLIAYGVLTSILFVRPQAMDGSLVPVTGTDCMRRMFVYVFAIIIPYFAISRSSRERRLILESMATFCLACALMAAIAVFEAARHWLLYGEMADRWGVGITFSMYVARGASLRAMASSGHPLALGSLLVIAFGFWLYLQSHVPSKFRRQAVTVLLWLGLFAAYSRGPWIGAVFIYLVFAALRPHAIPRILKAIGAGTVAVVIISVSPLRDKIVGVLPFLGGTIDSANITYRQRLIDRTLEVIRDSPWLGDQSALLKMQDLRQGQGLIDLVNSYFQILLDSGLLGLGLFLSFILIALLKTWALSRRSMRIDADFGLLGASIVSCILATLLLMENVSFGTGTDRMFYLLAALSMAYVYVGQSLRGGIPGRFPSTARMAKPA